MSYIADRRTEVTERITTLKNSLKDADSKIGNQACVYATGSFGRLDASSHSDLDLVIVGLRDPASEGGAEKSLLTNLDAICLKARLIETIRTLGIRDFDGDGKYLRHYSAGFFTKTLGHPEDDLTNTFTSRLLLLLESKAVIGETTYNAVIFDVIRSYWRDYDDHKDSFVPAFLANDILRLWRTFCVNYEARTRSTPMEKKIKRRIKNYKLKHSRLLTCYSALIYMLHRFSLTGTVTPDDAIQMAHLTPAGRLEDVAKNSAGVDIQDNIGKILEKYELFLRTTNQSEDQLTTLFEDDMRFREYMANASKLGQSVFHALNAIGRENHFHRLIVV
jgi:hypothetical protein